MNRLFLALFVLLSSAITYAQEALIKGVVQNDNGPLELAAVQIEGGAIVKGAVTDANGRYRIEGIPEGTYTLKVQLLGYIGATEQLHVGNTEAIVRDFELKEDWLNLEQVVITGTRTSKKRTDSPVIVDVIDKQALSNIQACNLAEGLKFQPGLRVETDCQTCNYTQLRMNGLQGGYSQILINGRPIFSPLTGLYGMEQLPVNMIERIEVVRGGGSALYGSSAIGGTVNVITRIPEQNGYEFGYAHQNTSGAGDHLLQGNATALLKSGNGGATFFFSDRKRTWYDHNGDNFSELPELKNNSFGAYLFFQPSDNQKIDINISSINEYRYGGEMAEGPAHMVEQAEERTHNVLIGNIDYQINFNEQNSSFIAFAAAQRTDRDHFTGIMPDDSTEIDYYLQNPPYGNSTTTTYQAGLQLNHRLQNFPLGSNVLTAGLEFVQDDVLDRIPAYDFEVDQLTTSAGLFMQSDWQMTGGLNVLAGLRADKHNMVDRMILSPRISVLYNLKSETQFRLTWSTGFRAPQAFDTDLHIAFAGGGVSRISLAPDLQAERSQSVSGSVNYDRATERFIAGFTVEGFYTHLRDAFYLQPIGEDVFGERFEKRNGDGAVVKGVTLEARANYEGKMQLEAGFTVQSSLYNSPVDNIEGLEATRQFLRTPDAYGYATWSFNPTNRISASVNYVHTGPMLLAHFGGAPEQREDAYENSKVFNDVSFRAGYTFYPGGLDAGLEIFGGIKNFINAYQDDFDSGKNRDSNYVYGPAIPRTFFLGIKVRSL